MSYANDTQPEIAVNINDYHFEMSVTDSNKNGR